MVQRWSMAEMHGIVVHIKHVSTGKLLPAVRLLCSMPAMGWFGT